MLRMNLLSVAAGHLASLSAVWAILTGLAVTLQAQEKEMSITPQSVINCGHRGASGHAPENTLAAIRLAMAMGAQMVEIDVQQTADDQLVLLHDDSLRRTTNGSGLLWQKRAAELQTLDAGRWFSAAFAGEPLPTLAQTIALVRGKIKLNIEVKLHGHERNIAQLVVDTIRRENFVQDGLITSFGHAVADEIKQLAPELRVGYIFGPRELHETVFTAPVEVLSAHYSLVNEEFMRKARTAGKAVHVWTVNDKALMTRLIALGVEAIITNYPDRLSEVLRAQAQ
ncbi:MAG: glycerophosphodiester phosphodiesterase family protein [candidate division KSB1 bacterium]|nr:glycerophosphodiester phosphodiesterase family protein [candidate division KSB1 bacterium]MDZ7274710.1 glycerophosphodiester phosphodiesterase family protein [candidate division KSB1 bacterium]MDZ7285535.1 glycerophosphodiester phosphodiesterase family protein [candidate division KSB1 bacterium]MDZ7298567.1 glycerophosphodiester phosphodiesterase family protein [candidate division KSB1 bacterium]MDZ7309235.1 glycerophosphodiester phosphodiesterase family protein [candidate division KSB1 bact